MPKLGTYRIALKQGGLMEDPNWHYEFLRIIQANSLDEAKDKWAEETGHLDKDWDPIRKTYWGWSVVCLEER